MKTTEEILITAEALGYKSTLGEQFRESIIRHAIRAAKPSYFGWFNICPVNSAAQALGTLGHNESYQLLTAYHCVNRKHIPKEIRAIIPQLIREALAPQPLSGDSRQGGK